MKYITKKLNTVFNTIPGLTCTYHKPAECPHCGIHCNADIVGRHFHKADPAIAFIIFKCTACSKFFSAVYTVKDNISSICCVAPSKVSRFRDELIEALSPKFIEIYNQALLARDNGSYDLAGIGYRKALEILIKDYAITELHKDESSVSKMKLVDAISDYLGDRELISSADVVRYLGNDYAHYKRRYDDLDFPVLDTYMDLFIASIRAKLLIAHPPVSRPRKDRD